MKSIITVLIAVLVSLGLYAQTQSSNHLSFKGVPIDGTLNEFVAKMKLNGFSLISTKDGLAMLSGDFAAYKNCIVGVATLKQKDLVSKITVVFPKCDTWEMLSKNYFNLKEMLTQKYGAPSESVEKFNTYSEPDDDQAKMSAVKSDNCKYYSSYETERGTIQLSIENAGFLNSFVMLAYYDKINGEIIKSTAIDDL